MATLSYEEALSQQNTVSYEDALQMDSGAQDEFQWGGETGSLVGDIGASAMRGLFGKEATEQATEQFGKSLALGMAEGIGGFVELSKIVHNSVLSAIETIAPSTKEYLPYADKALGDIENVRELFSAIGIPTDPEPSLGASITREASSALTGLGMLSKAGSLSQFAGGGYDYSKFSKALSALTGDITRAANITMGLSIPSGGSAYVAGAIHGGTAEERRGAEALGAFAGGVAAPATAYKMAKYAKSGGKTLSDTMSLTKESRRLRTGKILREAATPESLGKITTGDIDVPKYGQPSLGEVLDDPGLMSLEKTLATDEALNVGGKARALIRREARNNELIEAIDSLADDSVNLIGKTKSFIHSRIISATNKIKGRMLIAQENARRATSRLDPDATPELIQAKSKEHIESASEYARNVETELWTKLGGEYDTGETIQKAKDIIAEAKSMGRGHMVDDLVYRIAGEADVPALEGIDSIKRINVWRSDLLDRVRVLNAGKEFKDARSLKALAASLRDDVVPIGRADPQATEAARKFSKDLNKVFTSGPVGEMLGYEKFGAEKVLPEIALEKIGLGTAKGGVVLKNLRQGMVNLDIQSRKSVGDSVFKETILKLDGSVKEYLSAKFLLAKNKAKFIADHRVTLEQYPSLRKEMESADAMTTIAERVNKSTLARLKDFEKYSPAVKFLNEDPRVAVKAVLADKNPTKATQRLINLAAKDKTGETAKGVRAAFYSAMKERITNEVQSGELILNAKKMRAFYNSYRGPIKKLYGPNGDKLLSEVLRGATISSRSMKSKVNVLGSDTKELLAGSQGLKKQATAATFSRVSLIPPSGKGVRAAPPV